MCATHWRAFIKSILAEKNHEKTFLPKDIFPLVKKTSTAKFDESVDASFRINLKQSKSELNLSNYFSSINQIFNIFNSTWFNN